MPSVWALFLPLADLRERGVGGKRPTKKVRLASCVRACRLGRPCSDCYRLVCRSSSASGLVSHARTRDYLSSCFPPSSQGFLTRPSLLLLVFVLFFGSSPSLSRNFVPHSSPLVIFVAVPLSSCYIRFTFLLPLLPILDISIRLVGTRSCPSLTTLTALHLPLLVPASPALALLNSYTPCSFPPARVYLFSLPIQERATDLSTSILLALDRQCTTTQPPTLQHLCDSSRQCFDREIRLPSTLFTCQSYTSLFQRTANKR